jgi:hypothetical protein
VVGVCFVTFADNVLPEISPLPDVWREAWRLEDERPQLLVKFPPFNLSVVVPFQLHFASNVGDGQAATLLRQLEGSFKREFVVVHFSIL